MRFSVATKIFLGFTIVIASFGVGSLYSIYRMRTLGDNIRFIREGVLPVRDALKDLHSELKAFEEALGRRRATDLEWVRAILPSLRPFSRVDILRERVTELAAGARLKPRDRATLESLARELEQIGASRQALDGLLARGGLPAIQKIMGGPPPVDSDRALFRSLARALAQRVTEGRRAEAVQMQTGLRGIVRRVDRAVVKLERRFTRAIDSTVDQAESDEDNAILAVTVISAVALLISLAALLISHLTLTPIRQLREGVRRISEGDYGRRVRVSTRDEIGQLAAEFNKMAESLTSRDRMLARQREAVLRSERLATIGKMSSQITHEIRNPLSSLGLNVELLEEELASAVAGDEAAAEEARALLAAVTQEVDRLRGVTDQYLRFARPQSPDRGPGDVVKVLEDLLRFVGEELNTQAIELDARLDPVPELEIDVQQLRQAFFNIERNAVEAMPDGGRLRVSTAVEGDEVVVRFEDTGVGVPAEDIDKLFDPFFSTKRTGTGLGLAMTLQVISDHGGTLDVESEPGRGTVVTVRLGRGG